MTLLAKRKERSIVPRMYYITTAIDYTNGPPHIGHAYEKVLADVLARWHRMKGEEVYFLTGVDQHGQKVQQTAEKLGITPQEHVDNITAKFLALWERLGISNDGWASTTDPRHKACVQKILTNLKDRGQLYKKSYKGFYSVRQEQFLTDKERDAEGSFGPEWGEVVELEEENWYFRLTDHVEWMKKFVEKSSGFVLPAFRKAEVLNAIDFDSDLCISRPKSRLSWGIELPFDPEFVTYVWFDALINYVSFAGYLAEPDQRTAGILQALARGLRSDRQGHPGARPRRVLARHAACHGLLRRGNAHPARARMVEHQRGKNVQVHRQRGGPQPAGGTIRPGTRALLPGAGHHHRKGRQL